MKKETSILILLLMLPLVSAININMNNNYQPGETIIGSIEGNFAFQLTQKNFYFYSDRTQIPLVFDITKIQDKYYFYALLPFEEKTYNLVIKDVNYYENGLQKTGDFEKNFSVSGNASDFSVNPGFLVIKNQSYLTVESYSQPFVLSAKFLGSTQTLNVPLAGSKKIYFSSGNASGFLFANIELSALNTKYIVPAAIISQPSAHNFSAENPLRFSKPEYTLSVYEKNTSRIKLYLQNLGLSPVKNIRLNLSDTLDAIAMLASDNISGIEPNSTKTVELIIATSTYKNYIGYISAFSESFSAASMITINSVQQGQVLPSPVPDNSGISSCSEFQGDLCLVNQDCSGQIKNSLEGECCIGQCVEKSTSFIGWIIGIILILAVAGVLYFLYIRSKRIRITSEDVLHKTEKKFDERNLQVRGNLTKE